jgi:Tol biopolymer transport system component
MPSAGVPSWHPTIPRHGTGLAYQHILNASSIWCLDQATRSKKDPLMVVISTNGRNEGPQLSPNGKKLAFMSDRAGSMEIWVSDPDGSYPLKLTNLGGSGSPRWSPDSRIITFDAVRDGQSSVYVVDLDGSEPTEVKGAMPGDKVPSWSSDGKWIYFASERSGEDQVWKIPVSGGEPTQVTKGGGFAATESKDGKILYYAKTRYGHPEIWQIPTAGGKESLLSPLLRPGTWANWTVTSNGIFFVDDMGNDLSNLEYFDFQTRQVQLLVSLNGNSFWLSASQDGETLWYGQAAHDQSSIMVQPEFR